MKKIILDTNFLMAVGQFGIDIFEEIKRICDFRYKLYIIDKTKNELNKLIETNKGKQRMAAKLALLLVKSKGIEIIKTREEKNVDDLISNIANNINNDIIVATQDKILKSRLKKGKDIKLISIRQKKYLMLE